MPMEESYTDYTFVNKRAYLPFYLYICIISIDFECYERSSI
jgi:hypothetical protein